MNIFWDTNPKQRFERILIPQTNQQQEKASLKRARAIFQRRNLRYEKIGLAERKRESFSPWLILRGRAKTFPARDHSLKLSFSLLFATSCGDLSSFFPENSCVYVKDGERDANASAVPNEWAWERERTACRKKETHAYWLITESHTVLVYACIYVRSRTLVLGQPLKKWPHSATNSERAADVQMRL